MLVSYVVCAYLHCSAAGMSYGNIFKKSVYQEEIPLPMHKMQL